MHFVTWARWKGKKYNNHWMWRNPPFVVCHTICTIECILYTFKEFSTFTVLYECNTHLQIAGWHFFIGGLASLTQSELSLFTYRRYAWNMHKFNTWTKGNILEMIQDDRSLSGFFLLRLGFCYEKKKKPITFWLHLQLSNQKVFR